MSHLIKLCGACHAVILYAHHDDPHDDRLTIELGFCGSACKPKTCMPFPSWFVPPEKGNRKRLYARIVYSLSENGHKDSETPLDEGYRHFLDQRGKGFR